MLWKTEVQKVINTTCAVGGISTQVDIYHFKRLYPNNKHFNEKIRQTLQKLRDQGFVVFLIRTVIQTDHIKFLLKQRELTDKSKSVSSLFMNNVPNRCHRGTYPFKSPAISGFSRPLKSFPLNGCRGFGGNIIYYAVDTLYLINNAD